MRRYDALRGDVGLGVALLFPCRDGETARLDDDAGFGDLADSKAFFGGVVDALNTIIAITNTRKNQEGGTMVVPGRGRVADEADVVEYRDMLVTIRGRIAYYLEQGLSLAQVIDARPTMDYDARYAAEDGPAAPDRFVEIVYNELAASGGTSR